MSSTDVETGTQPETRKGHSRLAQDLHIKGNLTSKGVVEVQGTVHGDIDAGKLLIGPDGKVTGKVRAETVEVQGHLDGSASCLQFTLRASASAKAQVTYDTLVIENGATIDGKFKHAPSKS